MRFAKKAPLELTAATMRMSIPLDVSQGKGGGIAYAFDSAGGVLRPGIGAREVPMQMPEGETPCAVYKASGNTAVYAKSKEMFISSSDVFDGTSKSFSKLPADARIFYGEEKVLLSDGSMCLALGSGGLENRGMKFSCGACAYERFWHTEEDGLRLYFSAPGEPYSADEGRGRGGYIDLSDEMGNVLCLKFFKNDLYVVREYGLQKLEAYGDEDDFKLRDVFSCARVAGGSVATDGDTLFFLAEDGLHAYGAGKISDFSEYFCGEQENVFGAAQDGKYYISAKSKGTPVLGVFDSAAGGGYLIPAECDWLGRAENRVLFSMGGKMYEVTQAGTFADRVPHRVWQSAEVVPYGGRALLREVNVQGSGAMILSVRSDEGSRTVCVPGGSRVCRGINLAGTQFSFRILAEDCEVRSVRAVFLKGEGMQ